MEAFILHTLPDVTLHNCKRNYLARSQADKDVLLWGLLKGKVDTNKPRKHQRPHRRHSPTCCSHSWRHVTCFRQCRARAQLCADTGSDHIQLAPHVTRRSFNRTDVRPYNVLSPSVHKWFKCHQRQHHLYYKLQRLQKNSNQPRPFFSPSPHTLLKL